MKYLFRVTKIHAYATFILYSIITLMNYGLTGPLVLLQRYGFFAYIADVLGSLFVCFIVIYSFGLVFKCIELLFKAIIKLGETK